MGKITLDTITSKNNQLIKDTKKLLTSSRTRQENRAFVLEGARLCFDVLNSVYRVKLLLITESAYEKYSYKADKIIDLAEGAYFITDDIAKKLTDTVAAQGIFAVCKMCEHEQKIRGSKLIALDNVQDPSNVGAIIRTGEALGIDCIITYNCCDIFNPKTLRASMGSILRINIVDTDNLENTLIQLKKNYKIYSTVPDSKAEKITDIDFNANSICVIGNEANGVEDNIKKVSDALTTIPMLGRAESLNASVAASITMWEMLR
ncbi:MAG: TrmH family RNA methyltransferase [Eubacterium sp.]